MKTYLDQLYADERMKIGTRLLMSAIVDRAIRDVTSNELGISGFDVITAMAFINSDECRDICIEIGADYMDVVNNMAAMYSNNLIGKYISRRA